MEMSLMKPAKLTLVRPLSALVVRFVVTTQPRRGTRDTKGKRMEMSLMKPAKLTLVRPLSALVVRFVPFCGYA
jgi:hypothetical protein